MKIDTHIHTNYSKDCLTSIERVRKTCLKKGIIPCITDHSTIKGALAYQKKYGKKSCIVGEEIRTKQGEIMGLYMKKEIPWGLDLMDAMKQLKKQGAIIIVPHPFDRLRHSKLKYDISRLNKKFKIDFIEVFNSRTMFSEDNKKALLFAEKKRKKEKYLATVGSDAHTTQEIGNAFVIIPEFDITKKEQFLTKFKNSREITFNTKTSSVLFHGVTKTVKILKLNKHAN